jgi:ligand-binding sensor domain-containing protein/signal transduction histidine kinase
MRRASFFLIILLNLSLFVGLKSAFGKNNLYNLPDMYQGRILSWNTQSGMSQSVVNCIAQDSLGYIWVGTQDGLNRFDGTHFTIFKYQADNSYSLSSNSINCLLVDPYGGVISGTENGICRYDPRSKYFLRLFFQQQPTKRINVTALMLEKNGTLWFGTLEGAVYKYQLKTNSYRKYILTTPNLDAKNTSVTAIFRDGYGKIWITAKSGLFLIEKKKMVNLRNQTDNDQSYYSNLFVSSAFTSNGTLLLGSFGDGILALDTADKAYSRAIDLSKYIHIEFGNGIVNSVLADRDQNIWLGTDNGLVVMRKNAESPQVILPDSKQGLASKNIRSLFQDKEGNIWIGTWNGLNMYPKRNLPFYTVPVYENDKNKLINNSVLAILVDSKNRIWIGTDNQGLACFDQKSGKITHFSTANSKIHSNNIMTLTEDDLGNIWVGTWGAGFAIFNPQNDKFDFLLNTPEKPDLLSDNIIYKVRKAKNGLLYVATEHGIDVINPEKKEVLTHHAKLNTISDKIKALYIDDFEDVWIGGDFGIKKYRPSKNTLSDFYTNVPITNVQTLFYTHQTLWAGTVGDGLYKIDVKSGLTTNYNEKEGLSNTAVHSIIRDNNNCLWMSTNNGLCSFNLQNNTFSNFYNADGIQGDEFNSGAAFKDQNGVLFFCGTSGITFFNPSDFSKIKIDMPTLFVRSVFYDGNEESVNKELSYAKTLKANYSTKTITVDFEVANNYKNKPFLFSWKLHGFSDSWSVPSKTGSVTFTNLSPGSYLLEVRTVNADNPNISATYSLSIFIEAPFWMKWSFWIVVIVGAVAAFFIVQKRSIYRIEQKNKALEEKIASRTEKLKIATEIAESKSRELEEENKMKSRFFSIIAHDIKNPIWGISQISETVISNLSNQRLEECQNKMTQINNASKNLGSLLENLLTWASAQSGRIIYQPEVVNVYSLVDDVVDFYEGFSMAKKIEIKNNIDPELFVLVDKHSMQVVFQNLISNAIKFSFPESTVAITSKATETTVEISITDNGVGIDATKLNTLFDITALYKTSGTQNEQGTGLGLLLCKEFVQKNAGSIHVSSMPKQGTTFRITLPKTSIMEMVEQSR